MAVISSRVGDLPILELGCGRGRDTRVLAMAGHHVVGIDLSAASIAEARIHVPSCEFHCQDIRAPFPAATAQVHVVLASLSLHYFPWNETLAIVLRIRAALGPSGALLCRLNATDDHHHSASGHPALEENYYRVDGAPKRFFDRASIDALFGNGWSLLHVEHHVVHRDAQPKALWEVVVEPAA